MRLLDGVRSTLLTAFVLINIASAVAPSDTSRDADAGQSGYVGGGHNIDPETASQFKILWNATFDPDERHWARPLVYTLSSNGRQIVFTASTTNTVRTFDAINGTLLASRQIQPPWPMDAAYCTTVSKTMGIMGTPLIYEQYDVVFFYVKSYIEDFRVPGGVSPPMNAVYYLNAVYLDSLLDVYYWPIFIDNVPADNDPRKMFLGGLVLQRPSLAMVGDTLYAGFGGMCDAFNYTGVLVAVNVNTQKINRWATQAGPSSAYTSDWTAWHGGGAGGIWQAGMGLATDGSDVFFTVDNGGGSTDKNISTTAISGKAHMDVVSESVVRVNTTDDAGVQMLDWFRPFDFQTDNGEDIGSGGVAVLNASVFRTSSVKRIGVATSKNRKMYVLDLDNLGGYRQAKNSTDAVLQTIPLEGEVYGGIGSYPLEGGYIYVNAAGAPLSAYRFNASTGLFSFAGTSSTASPHALGVGIPTVTSRDGEPGTGIVWVTDAERGLLAYKAVPVNGTLVEIPLPKVEGAMMYSRPTFGDGRVYLFDARDRLVALGVK